jgi:hypothetical protein
MSCGLVLYRDYDYCGGRKINLPYRDNPEPTHGSSVSTIDFEVKSWNKWLVENKPKIYPQD